MAATGTEAQVKNALFTRLRAFSYSPAVPVSWPDVTFTPPSAGPWFEAKVFAAPTEGIGIAHDAHNFLTGFLQVTVATKIGGGEIAPSELAALIVNWFKRGTQMTDSSLTIEIVRPPYVMSSFREEPWLKTPVTIRYQAYARQS